MDFQLNKIKYIFYISGKQTKKVKKTKQTIGIFKYHGIVLKYRQSQTKTYKITQNIFNTKETLYIPMQKKIGISFVGTCKLKCSTLFDETVDYHWLQNTGIQNFKDENLFSNEPYCKIGSFRVIKTRNNLLKLKFVLKYIFKAEIASCEIQVNWVKVKFTWKF